MPKIQAKCQAQAEDVAYYAARFRLDYTCFCGPGSEKIWEYNEDTPSHQFADETISRLACSTNLSLANTEGSSRTNGGIGTHFKTSHLMLVNMVSACTQLCLYENKMQVKIGTSFIELNQEVSDGASHQEPQICAVG